MTDEVSDEQIAKAWWGRNSAEASNSWEYLPSHLQRQYTAKALLEVAKNRADAAIAAKDAEIERLRAALRKAGVTD